MCTEKLVIIIVSLLHLLIDVHEHFLEVLPVYFWILTKCVNFWSYHLIPIFLICKLLSVSFGIQFWASEGDVAIESLLAVKIFG
jgi:hypothetical protein